MTIDEVIMLITAAGFAPDGATRTEVVRVPTVRSPLLGGIGGERRTFGGRQRFTKAGSTVRITVGPRTVNVYRVEQGATTFLANYNTKQLAAGELQAILEQNP